MAPTKSLCSERRRDWSEKFAKLGLKCEELTGDTDPAHLREAAIADIIVTTPEKWDSMTRKWTDHKKLLQLVKLFLVDEVHIVKEKRGATLEAVVSRMKSAEFEVRFIALSATVPNSEDIAAWLGRSPTRQHLPARLENFGEEFRPVKLQKHVFGLPSRANDFAFDKACDSRLWELIAKHSSKKPIMIFCCTRNSAQQTAELLASTWVEKSSQDRFWVAPSQMLQLQDAKLRNFTQCGVAFHHAGLASTDRIAIEKGFLTRQISVICCTSTLAVGVNLPCHLVIIKNTMTWQETGLKEYADLEMMQMLGRAGRPQFDKDAVAVIITKVEKVEKYRKLIQGQELLESCLHLNLIEHLNAEISLRTVSDLMSAKKWLSGTFLSVRLGLNPAHYQFDANGIFKNLDERIEHICQRDINLLQQADLVVEEARLRCTLFGHAMSRYYVNFKTMKLILGLPPNAKMSEILSVVAQAEEFHEIRFKGGEKSLYRSLNSAQGIKYPIKVDFALAAHKRSIIMQAELGGVEFPAEDQFNKHRMQYQQDRAIILAHANRLMRCIIDCLLAKADAPAARHALELARSLAAHVWDDSPLQMRQIEGIGPVSVRKLAAAGINSLETLEQTEASRIADILGKQRVTGESVLLKVRNFPKVRVSVKIMGQEIKAGKPPKINIKAEVGFVNEIVPFTFNKKSIFVCFIAERSDGHLLDFRRFSAKKLANAEEVCLSAELLDARQHITCYVMCDEIAGTVQYAELKPRLPGHVFPPPLPTPLPDLQTSRATVVATRTGRTICSRLDVVSKSSEDFLDDDLDDAYLAEAEAQEADFRDVDDSPQSHAPLRGLKGTRALATNARAMENDEANEPEQLNNGKWACNHKCKDKTVCKHLCCREGLDKKPKPKKLTVTNESQGDIDTEGISKGSKSTSIVSVNAIRRSTQRSINEPEIVDLSHGQPARSHSMEDCGHESSSLTNPRSNEITLPAAFKPSTARPAHREVSSDYGDDQWMDDLPPLSELLEGPSILPKGNASKRQPEKDIFDLNPTSDDVEMPDPTMPELQKKKPLIYEPTNVETPLSEEGVGFEYRSGDDQCLTIDEMEEAQFPMDDDIEQPHLEEEVQSSNLPSGSSSSTLKQQLGSSESRRDSPPTQAESENLFLHTSSDIPNDAAALAPPASHQTPTSLTNHEKRTLELEDEYPASPSLPPAKRIKEGVEISTRAPNHLTDGKGVINADLYDVYALPVGHRLRPWEDMSGVDLNLLLEYVDHVDFV
ncbi:Sec63 [Agyrium rufum]|nr:Sec63 [Agyrium rufum]